MKLIVLFLSLAMAIATPCVSWAWDYVYDGTVLPNDPSLGSNRWVLNGYLDMCSTDGDVLRIADTRTNGTAYFSRGATTPGPITMEARVRVVSASPGGVELAVGTASFSTGVELYPHYLQVYRDYTTYPTYQADLTAFHLLRIAINAQGQSYVWLDQTPVAQGVTHVGGQGWIYFGAGGVSESYWDYVAYSNAFLPIPEPSSLLALLAGLGSVGGVMLRRRRL